MLILTQTLGAANIATNDFTLAARVLDNPGAFQIAGLQLKGMVALSQGFMLSCLVWSAAAAYLIDRRFLAAARFMLIGALLAFFGFIHAGSLSPAGGPRHAGRPADGVDAAGYALCAGFFGLTAVWVKHSGQEGPPPDDVLSGHG